MFNLAVALEKGAAFVFGSWICIANGSGSFDSHLATLGCRRHQRQHPAMTLTNSPTISVKSKFPI
jgi:hypothetical protein